ncbi:hypothetical protein OSTOST_00602 [Ostertagia ostertagi]
MAITPEHLPVQLFLPTSVDIRVHRRTDFGWWLKQPPQVFFGGMLLLLWILPLVVAQNLYGPSQLDQYARLFNSGNLGGFGLFQNAMAQVMRQLTSTAATPSTRPTAVPTTPPTNPGGIYAINTLVELPPIPENRIHGTFDEDGVFHPNNEGKDEDDVQIVRNQEDGSFEDPPKIRSTSNAGAHRLAQHNEKSRKPRQNPALPRRQIIRSRQIRRQQQDSSVNAKRNLRQAVVQQPRYPPFVFRPKPPPPEREQEYNNLLAEIEEYDDFLEQQRVYLSHYPKATLQNPYRDLPPGQLPAAGSYSAGSFNAPTNIQQPNIPAPSRNPNQGVENFRPPPPPQSPQPQAQPQQQQPFWPQPPQPQNLFPPPFSPPSASTDNPLLKIFNFLSIPHHHAHALAAPQVSLEDDPPTTKKTTTAAPTPLPRPNPYQLGMLPIPPSSMPLVDIHQQPLQPLSFPQLGSPLVLQPLFSHGK